MRTLDDAWRWYRTAKAYMQTVRRLANHHWAELPKDKLLVTLDAETVVSDATGVLNSLDDLAIVVLFSVFEMTVRSAVLDEMATETATLAHPVLVSAAGSAREGVEVGSFARVLDPYKAVLSNDLIEQVNQVRRYRNWVAHGKRGDRVPAAVSPETAYDRLNAFLAALGGGI